MEIMVESVKNSVIKGAMVGVVVFLGLRICPIHGDFLTLNFQSCWLLLPMMTVVVPIVQFAKIALQRAVPLTELATWTLEYICNSAILGETLALGAMLAPSVVTITQYQLFLAFVGYTGACSTFAQFLFARFMQKST